MPSLNFCLPALLVAIAHAPVFSNAAAAPGETSLVVRSRPSATATEGTSRPAISANGRYVIFRSTAPNLVAGDRNLSDDIFIFDRATDSTTRVDEPRACSVPADSWIQIRDAAISNSGRYVVWIISELCGPGDEDGTASIVLLDRQTEARRLLDSSRSREFFSPQFSADSAQLVYEMVDWLGDGYRDIWMQELSTGLTTLVSDGAAPGDSFSPTVNSDGSLVAFASLASDLASDDTNNVADIFLFSRSTGGIVRISRSNSGAQANGPSATPAISANGKFVAYSSAASNLIAGDTNGVRDVFTYDVVAATTARASKRGNATQLNGASRQPWVSADGRYVVFSSRATNAVSGDTNNAEDVFIRDRATSTTIRVSEGPNGTQGNGSSREPQISKSGRFVSYMSKASNLVADDNNRATDVFLLDRQEGTLFVATKSERPTAGLPGIEASISADGTQVAFESSATGLVAGDTNSYSDIFVRDYTQGKIVRVSKTTAGEQANFTSSDPSISANGRFVAFVSTATNLVTNDKNSQQDVFVHDRQDQTTIRANISSSGVEANWRTELVQISSNGRYVLFLTRASNLVPGDDADSEDLFIRDLVAGTTKMANLRASGERVFLSNQSGALNVDGRYVVFSTRENLAPDDTKFDEDVYLRDRQLGTVERISVPVVLEAAWCCRRAFAGAVSAGGRYVIFSANTDEFVSGDTNGNGRLDAFVRDRQLGTTALVSVMPIGLEILSASSLSVSNDGRYASFTGSLLAGGRAVFFRDLQQSTAVRASRSTAGTAANSDAFDSSMSGDGRFLVFSSDATNLVPQPIAGETIFRHEAH